MVTVLIDSNTRSWTGDAAAATVRKAIKGTRDKAYRIFWCAFSEWLIRSLIAASFRSQAQGKDGLVTDTV